MNDDASSRWTRRALAALPIVLIGAVGVFAAFGLRDDAAPEPRALPPAMDIVASGPRFDSLDELIEASDVIVEGRVVGVDSGRTITDPADPDAGVITSLFQLDVITAYSGTTADAVIIEQEASLLDGTPIVVNGLRPNQVGDTGFWFLVRSPDDAFPYVALVNEQGRMLIDTDTDTDTDTDIDTDTDTDTDVVSLGDVDGILDVRLRLDALAGVDEG